MGDLENNQENQQEKQKEKLQEIAERVKALELEFNVFKGTSTQLIKELRKNLDKKIDSNVKEHLKDETEALLKLITNNTNSINSIIQERKINWDNLDKLGEYLEQLHNLKSKFSSFDNDYEKLKDYLDQISDQNKTIRDIQKEWEFTKKEQNDQILEIKKLVEALDKARKDREEERIKEQKEHRKFILKIFLWAIPIVIGIITFSLTTGLNVVKTRDEKKEKINLERHNEVKRRIEKLEKSDEKLHDKIEKTNKDFYDKIYKLIKEK